MSILSTILKSLGTPDAQERDWYGWATNQCSHALFGVFTALLFPLAALQMTLIFAVAKESLDIVRDMTTEKLKDSLVDISFWLIGAIVIVFPDPVVGIILMVFGLIIGIVPRIRKLLRESL